MSDEVKKVMCTCGREIELCQRCGFHPVEHNTTDDQYLCATCAQDSHIPCGGCGEVVPCEEADENGECLDCRLKHVRSLIKRATTARNLHRAGYRLASLQAEQVLLYLIGEGTLFYAGVDLRGTLLSMRHDRPML